MIIRMHKSSSVIVVFNYKTSDVGWVLSGGLNKFKLGFKHVWNYLCLEDNWINLDD